MSPELLLTAALSTLIGLLLGLLSGGGGMLAVPLFTYLGHFAPPVAIAMSLAVVSSTSAFTSVLHLRKQNVAYSTALIMVVAGSLGSFGGAKLTHMVQGKWLLLLFGLLMLYSGFRMIRGKVWDEKSQDITPAPLWIMGVLGVGIGGVTGFLGVGGGFLLVPALYLIARLPMQRAMGTALTIIAGNSLAGFISHTQHIEIPIMATAIFAGSAFVGAIVGKSLSGRLSTKTLKMLFGYFVIIIGMFVLIKNANLFL